MFNIFFNNLYLGDKLTFVIITDVTFAIDIAYYLLHDVMSIYIYLLHII